MQNNKKILLLFLIFYISIFSNKSYAIEDFNFDVTEVEILENGNIFKGLKRGKIVTNDGLILTADSFEYNQSINILNAKGNVKIEDLIKDYIILTEEITYIKNQEKILTKGNTNALIQSKYNFQSTDVIFLRNKEVLYSLNKSTVKDNNLTSYNLKNFRYYINKNLLKGDKVEVISDYSKSEFDRDQYFFENGIFNLEKKEFIASDTKLILKRNLFGIEDNSPRVLGVSSKKSGNITTINKAVFTSCNSSDKCPPWSITSNEIKHDLDKKQLIYKNAVLKVYNLPILYFPKFFHPDPTVKRQSGFLTPQINDSEILGSSIHIPYFHVISDNRDLTIKPTIFDSDIYMLNNEYRHKNKNSSLIADIGHTNGYISKLENNQKKNSIFHLFTNFSQNLDFNNFYNSKLNINLEKTNNDTYLKVFDTNLIDKKIKPKNQDQLTSSIKLELDNQDFNLSSNISMYENLSGTNNDKYQYVFPSYSYSKIIMSNDLIRINFNSQGDNSLQNTNNLRTSVVNDFEFLSNEIILKNGITNNYGAFFKNVNTMGKNDTTYKNSPQTGLINIFNYEASLPLFKQNSKYYNYLVPKISFRINPGDMKNHSQEKRIIDTGNVFSINRTGLSDSFEQGKSITLGVDYKKENIRDINSYFDLKLATVFRDKIETKIPSSSSLDTKSSNLFGSTTFGISERIFMNYKFSLDNNFKNLEYNNLETKFILNKFSTKFNFIEENGKIGATNSIENTTEINFDDSNYFYFNTRRNREKSLTEYYDLIYEYKNDCLIAGIKYKKTFYEDRDVIPKEDLLFTITLFPLTTYEQRVDQNLYRN